MSDSGGRTGIDRRTFIRRASIAGAVAWTAPVLLDSLMSPAAAASVGKFSTGEVVSSTSSKAGTQPGATGGFTNAVSSSQVVIILIAASWPNDGSNAQAVSSITGPFSSTTLIQTMASSNGPWLQQGSGSTGSNTAYSHHMYAYYAVGNNTTTAVKVAFTKAPNRATVTAFTVSGATTSGPIGSKSTASDTSSPYATPTFNIGGATAGRAMVAFGALSDTGAGVSWTPPTGFTELADLSATDAAQSNGNIDMAAAFGPAAASTSAGAAVANPWATIAFEIK